ncbi:MAG: SUMF1/EgtB/PvdO family nonheme iron enzyme, partial [Bacteroidales bacterium]|nr:SUMF1/EgtB/PvdO family nonheme iron enzyme [Bacteroidales bacterium]
QRLILSDSGSIDLDIARPVFSFELNGRYRESNDVNTGLAGTRFILHYEESLRVTFASFGSSGTGWRGEVTFENEGFDTLVIANVLPFGANRENVYITGDGPLDLARAWLHRPGYQPLRVILPDNAWEAGYASFELNNNLSLASLIRRGKNEGAITKRYTTELLPGSKIVYNMYGELFEGEWQAGLRKVFRDKYMYDVYEFDNSLFEREDLKWIRNSYLIALQFAWDSKFYDRFEGKYKYGEFLKEFNSQFGHLDVFGIWPSWPRLGLDRRNQWDLYANLPGGTTQLRNFARLSRQYDTRFFIAFNPWDLSTRDESPMIGMARLIKEVEADGVVLDTRGASSSLLQESADNVRPGVVMYSEGMAIPSAMEGIVSGRVHNALYLAPELNLNKLIKPEFAIFRVCDVGEDILHREIALAFFNGYGTELNFFRPGRDFQLQKDYDFLASTTMILRENTSAFLDPDWIPLLNTNEDNILVNRWGKSDKYIYTVYSKEPKGFSGALFEVENTSEHHFVSLWHSEELEPLTIGNKEFIDVSLFPYPDSYKGSRREGAVDCIARFAKILNCRISSDTLHISSDKPGDIRVYKGPPSYKAEMHEFTINKDTSVFLPDLIKDYEGKLVIQLLEDNQLADLNYLNRTGANAWLISRVESTEISSRIPKDMLLIPTSDLSYQVKANDNFIPYPFPEIRRVRIDSFLIDRYPVTNIDYYRFVVATNYFPQDTVNYLRSWDQGIYGQGQEKYPVVYISLEDAKAYADWAGKRLPTENEWQLAAQGTDGRTWPWGNEFHGTKCNNSFDRATPVNAFPKGESPFGVFDMVGNIWQMTNDVYFNGTHYFNIIRGGSHYKPTSSWWYIEGGPQPLNKTQMLLLVSPGFDRSPTVGFRCVKD